MNMLELSALDESPPVKTVSTEFFVMVITKLKMRKLQVAKCDSYEA